MFSSVIRCSDRIRSGDSGGKAMPVNTPCSSPEIIVNAHLVLAHSGQMKPERMESLLLEQRGASFCSVCNLFHHILWRCSVINCQTATSNQQVTRCWKTICILANQYFFILPHYLFSATDILKSGVIFGGFKPSKLTTGSSYFQAERVYCTWRTENLH